MATIQVTIALAIITLIIALRRGGRPVTGRRLITGRGRAINTRIVSGGRGRPVTLGRNTRVGYIELPQGTTTRLLNRIAAMLLLSRIAAILLSRRTILLNRRSAAAILLNRRSATILRLGVGEARLESTLKQYTRELLNTSGTTTYGS